MYDNEQWCKWEFMPGFENKYELRSIKDDRLLTYDQYAFVIELVELKQNKKIHVIFDGFVDMYQSTQIDYRSDRLSQIKKNSAGEFDLKWPLYKSENSELSKWLYEESGWLVDFNCEYFSYKHFVIVSATCVIDVIVQFEPKIEFID